MCYGGDIAWNRTWGGIQQIIYLLGSFGIPLFFVVNGYLLSQKYIDFKFAITSKTKYLQYDDVGCFPMKKEKLLKGGGNLHIEVENGKVKAIKRYM